MSSIDELDLEFIRKKKLAAVIRQDFVEAASWREQEKRIITNNPELVKKSIDTSILSMKFSDHSFITNVCASYNHAYGLMTEDRQRELNLSAKSG